MRAVFLDTSFASALSSARDRHHTRAVEVAAELQRESTAIFTTRAVSLEIGNALAKRNYREAATQLIRSLESDPAVTIAPLSEDLFQRGVELFSARTDKDWSLTDCVSFVLMSDHSIADALTADRHFQQAGFQALLLSDTA